MTEIAWKYRAEPAPNTDCVAVVTYLSLKTVWALPKFLFYANQIQAQLQSAPGLIGYSRLARLPAKRFWTLSVWRDEAALANFVRAQPHKDAMTSLSRQMETSEFKRWNLQAAALPASWQEALAKLALSARLD